MSLTDIATGIIMFAAVIAAIAGIWRGFGFGKLKKRTADFLDDWMGEPSREGYEGRPSFPARMSEVERRTKQLEGNGGSHLADDIRKTHDQVTTLTETVQSLLSGQDELRGFASDNRQGIARLDQRVTDVQEEAARLGEKADALGQRQTDHRRRNDEQISALREYLEGDRDDLLLAKQGLESAVTELLSIREPPVPHTRATDPETPDHEPDL